MRISGIICNFSKTSESSLIRLATEPVINMELRSNKLICHTDGHPAPVVRYYDAFENEVLGGQGIYFHILNCNLGH